ncbi:heat shock protein 30 [Mucor ambiguus]|uniref:Heat shock protein 30 n=1 Tax=Mucor ambiguus TaxID=91626 RepID=A0A0C9LZM9_9FUNG|nr:heat shock protein 30 [Mucor ambiguus]
MSLTQRVFSDAFRDMQRAMAAFDQPFYNTARRSLLGSPASLFNGNTAAGGLFRYPATDMVETPESYELSAELPGYNKDNIKIELADSRTLVLSGTVNESKEIKPPTATEEVNATASTEDADTTTTASEATSDTSAANNEQQLTQKASSQVAKPTENSPQWWVKERVSGSFTRSFAFPTPINSDNIKASFDNGVLKVVIPKTTQDQAKQINIE